MKAFAKITSALLYPLFIPTYSLILLFQGGSFAQTSLEYKLFIIGMILLITTVMPMFCIMFMIKAGLVKDIQLDRRSDRTVPYLFSFFSFAVAILFFWKMNWPSFVIALVAGSMIAEAIVAIINTQWKISAHLCGMGGLSAAILIISLVTSINCLPAFVICILLSGLLATSRLYLQAHDWKQVLAGYLDGFICVYLLGFLAA